MTPTDAQVNAAIAAVRGLQLPRRMVGRQIVGQRWHDAGIETVAATALSTVLNDIESKLISEIDARAVLSDAESRVQVKMLRYALAIVRGED